MDGTLVDTEPMWLASETELMQRYEYEWTQVDQANCLGGPMDRVGEYMHRLAGGVETPEFFTNTLVGLMADHLRDGAALMEGANEIMATCEDLEIPMALVSASPRILVDAVLGNLVDHNFRVAISADDVLRVKPDPEGYISASRFLDLDIKECLILEDSLIGIEAAKASGACVIAIPHLVPIQESERVRVVSSVKELTAARLKDYYSQWHS